MGCSNSVTQKDGNNRKLSQFVHSAKFKAYVRLTRMNTRTTFCKEEVDILKKTWPCLMKELQENGLQVFLRIFEVCPSIKALFHVENVRLSQLARDETLKVHGGRFMSVLGDAVSVLGDEHDMEKLENKFLALGKWHQQYDGFRAEYFEIFYDAIIWQLEQSMGLEYTPEVSDAWSRLVVFIIQMLKQGYMPGSSMSTEIT